MSGPTELGRAITSGGATYFHLWKKDPSHGQWKRSPSADFSGGRHVFPHCLLPGGQSAPCPYDDDALGKNKSIVHEE